MTRLKTLDSQVLFSLLYLYVFHRGVMAPPSSAFYPIMIVFFYRPQRNCGKVMFLHLSVILFTGGVSAQGWYLPGGVWADTPPGIQTLLGRHPLPSACWDTHPLPSVCWDIHPPTQCMLGYTPAQCTLGYTPPAQCMLGYGQPAGGTHPTGMHSSFFQ